MMPLYGFLEGDTVGLLILGREEETVQDLADKLQASASVRVKKRSSVKVIYKGRTLDPWRTLASVGIQPLDRFDVVGQGDG